MLIQKAPNINGVNISVTTTVADLFDLINTAASTSEVNAGYKHGVNGIDIRIEDGDIRYLDDGNIPTTSKGVLGEKGDILFLRHSKLADLKLIAVTGTVKCSIRIGICEREESSAIATGSVDVTLEAGDIEIGAVEIKNATTDDRVTVDTDGNMATIDFAKLVPAIYDYIALTYVAAGNGAGEAETVTYKTGGSGGTTQATLTLTYDASDNVATVTKS